MFAPSVLKDSLTCSRHPLKQSRLCLCSVLVPLIQALFFTLWHCRCCLVSKLNSVNFLRFITLSTKLIKIQAFRVCNANHFHLAYRYYTSAFFKVEPSWKLRSPKRVWFTLPCGERCNTPHCIPGRGWLLFRASPFTQ